MKNLMAGHFPIPKPMANMLKITGFDLRMVAMDGYGSMSKPKKNGRYQETIQVKIFLDLSIVYRIHIFLEGYTDRFYNHVVFQSIPISIIRLVIKFSIVIMGLRYSYTNLLL